MLDFIGQLATAGINLAGQSQTNWQNQKNFNTNLSMNKNQNVFTNGMLEHFIKTGNIKPDQFKQISYSNGEDYITDSWLNYDLLNPFLALESHKISKDLSYNGVQRKVEDLKKSGLSPLLATGSSPLSYTGSGSSNGKAPQGVSANTQSWSNINMQTGLLKELAELKLLDKQADKIEAETNTEYEKASNLNENTKLLIAQTSHELSKQNLTKTQIAKYEKDVEILINDFNISKDLNMRYKDNKPYIFNAAEDLVSNLGIDSGTALFDWLVGAVVGTVFLSKAGTIGNIAIKGGKKVLDYGKTLGHKGKEAFNDGINYVKSKFKKDIKDDNFEPPHISEPFN